ncbi:hypothetical protein COL83_21255 [Bacillus wiedmannii]|nr:hypothetical protein COL83_21255 [Bacillus wiedmannii]
MKIFKSGDILIARRNVYLKRASIVNFDGITSGDSIVLRIEDKLLRSIIPFILNTDEFWGYAEKFSDGTMSKRLSPKILLEYEFMLPEIGKQEKLAELLWAANNTKEAYKKLLYITDELVKAHFIEMFGDPITNPLGWQSKPLLETGKCKNGMNYSSNESGVKIHCLGVGDFKNLSEIRDTSLLTMIALNSPPSEEYLLQNGDIIFVRSNGNKELVGRCLAVYPDGNSITYSGFCIRFRLLIDSLKIPYLLQMFKSNSVRQKMVGRGSNIQNLNQKILSEIDIPIPPIELQNQFEEFVQHTDKSKFELQQNIENLESTIKALMSKNFG